MEVDGGFIDILLERSPLLPDVKYEWAWEIKYLKKKDKKLLASKKEDALAQLKRYRQTDRINNRPGIRYAALIFIGKDNFEIVKL